MYLHLLKAFRKKNGGAGVERAFTFTLSLPYLGNLGVCDPRRAQRSPWVPWIYSLASLRYTPRLGIPSTLPYLYQSFALSYYNKSKEFLNGPQKGIPFF